MSNLSEVSETLFIPMEARIYASKKFPNILNDKMALTLESKLPKDKIGHQNQSQYTLMASAVRSMNMDRYIKDFLTRNNDGVIVELGIGLETSFYRSNDKNTWYGIDLPPVIDYRDELITPDERQILIKGSIFDNKLLDDLNKKINDKPVLFVASGLLYYFEKDDVINLLKKLKEFKNSEIVFDTVSKSGMKLTRKYMKQIGHDDAKMYFYVEDINELVNEVKDIEVLDYQKFYSNTDKKGMNFITKASMVISDLLFMVKMIHLRLN